MEEGASQSDDRDVRRRLKDLSVKADKSKNYSAKTAQSAYNNIMKEANNILQEIEMPRGKYQCNEFALSSRSIMSLFLTSTEAHMDYQIFGTMVRKNREAIDKERGGLFDDEQFSMLLACKHFKQNANDGSWSRDQGTNWVKFGGHYSHLIKTPRHLEFAHGSFDPKIETQATPSKRTPRRSKIAEPQGRKLMEMNINT